MKQTRFVPARSDSEILDIAVLAEEIWHEHFTDIIGKEQVDYMIEKFQSFPALKEQIQNGYEYFQIYSSHTMAGYSGIHEEDGALFLSKLYIKKEFRGQHLASEAFRYLVQLCRDRGISKIWLTCNKHNANTLAVYDHLGFKITDEQVADIGNGFVMDDYILACQLGV